MLHLPTVTLVSVAAIGYEKTIRGMVTCQNGIEFAASRLLSPTRPQSLPESIEWIETPPLRLRAPGIDDYSHLVLYDLWQYVSTDHCLVVQGDGFVANPGQWDPNFLGFDYIGAPWPVLPNAYIDPFGNHQRVGNGGFSLRSSRLLRTPLDVEIPWDVNNSDFYRHMNAGSLAEDGNISVHNKHIFEANGCKFAPVDVAVRFAQELPVPEARGVVPFGFHKYPPGNLAAKLRQLRHLRGWR